MRWVVTAGGTREAIDDVRAITNTSTGRLGAAVADAARAAGHEVLLLHAADAVLPDSDVRRQSFVSTADLARLLAAAAPTADVIVHAAAVSDYVPARISGKISSDAEELVLRLERAPKLIDRLREQCPDGYLVGFKLTSGATEAERDALARRQMERARLDAVVTNDVSHVGPDDHEAVMLGVDGELLRTRGKAEIARRLVEEAELHARAAT